MEEIFITKAVRTPVGSFQGALKNLSAIDLAYYTLINLIGEGVSINEIILGCVLQAGLGQAAVRQICTKIGLETPGFLVNKVCASGLLAVAIGAQSILAGQNKSVIAGGMESMTNAPFLSLKARAGLRFGHSSFTDHLLYDGLENRAGNGEVMGILADKAADYYKISRENQDNYAIETYQKALKARNEGWFSNEIVPIIHGENILEHDETIDKFKPDKVTKLKPVFSPNGTVNAATSSSLSDGAAALLLTSKTAMKNLEPMAKIVGVATFTGAPEWFTVAPVHAIKKLLNNLGWNIKDVDLWEINEAFAVVPLIAIKELKLSRETVNVHGGACALGHPLGATGAKILTTLVNALNLRGLNRGIVSLCIGGGEGIAMAIETNIKL